MVHWSKSGPRKPIRLVMMGWLEIEFIVGNMMTGVDGSARVIILIPVFKIGGTGVETGSAGSIPVHSRVRRTLDVAREAA